MPGLSWRQAAESLSRSDKQRHNNVVTIKLGLVYLHRPNVSPTELQSTRSNIKSRTGRVGVGT